MKSLNVKSALPHLIAVIVFLLVAVIFCRPALESGVILKQGDVTGWQGMSHQAMLYKEIHGHFPLWLSNMFGGMPAYQVAMEGDWSPLSVVNNIIQLDLPQPMSFFFLACISFYFLCICIGVRPYAAIAGALGFAYCSFSPIIITAGHNTQMYALAYTPAVLGAIILLFRKKYLIGFSLTALLTALQIAQGHQQISYYLFLIIGIMSISYLIYAIKENELPQYIKSIGLAVIAGILGVACNALLLMTSYDYAKESKRGGQLVMDQTAGSKDAVKDGKTVGLSKDYAFQWSYGKAETWSLIFPGVMGYGSHQAERDGDVYVFPKIEENSHLVKYMQENLPQLPADQLAGQMNGALYWGDQPFTNGPVYLGAVICFLFITGLFILDGKHKWWMLAASVLGILLAWGSHFPFFNYFMFDHFPFYNKFRVPTMALVIPQLIFPAVAALTLNQLMSDDNAGQWKKFVKAGLATAIVFVIAFACYISFDYSKENRQRTSAFNALVNDPSGAGQEKFTAFNEKFKPEIDNQILEGMAQNLSQSQGAEATKSAKAFVSALRQDRASLFMSDILRSFLFVLIAAVVIALFLKKKINALAMVIGIMLLTAIDLLQFGSQYMNRFSYTAKDNYETQEFPLSEADNQIAADKDPDFRVMNTAGLDESRTSYYHKSIGGYHPAKLGIYDDLMAYQLSGSPNMNVINMLNTKYFIQQTEQGKFAKQNPMALGHAWFVKGAKFVVGPVAEMKALNSLNPADSAVIDKQFARIACCFEPADSLSSITLKHFDNDTLVYSSTANKAQMAIFSEIYYKDWNAYIDGKSAPIFKANYVLRGMIVPAGNHTIEFRFEPAVYKTGNKIASISSWLVIIIAIVSFVWILLGMKKKENIA